ncbi:MAG: metal ABC transporter permease [Verrucomicrobiota bacterium]|nr:metal ABC transporter permease [Verrucomicrobiota bacterium]
MHLSRYTLLACVSLFWVESLMQVQAGRIGEITEITAWDQALRFFSFKDPALRYALAGAILLGLNCGLLGSFLVVRKLSLVGDTISHAVLPGVAAGFLWNMEKDPLAIFVGATMAGLLGSFMVSRLTATTKLKEDTALGMVLAGFFGLGICLVTMIQRLPTGNKSGIDKFLFGQAASLGGSDIYLMASVAFLTFGLVWIFYKELLTVSFDAGFAHCVKIPVSWFHHGFMLLLAFSVVIALQAVGVVLVSAMLITPAATAYLMTDRLHRMVFFACLAGMLAGAMGAFFSFLGHQLPTGPFMVLSAAALFVFAFFLAPRHGIILRWWARRSRSGRVRRENTLKAVFHALEQDGFRREGVTFMTLSKLRRQTLEETETASQELRQAGFATLPPGEKAVYLTPEGMRRAQTIVRNHRLWELYLTDAANYPPDHVHDDAEEIEHVLGEDLVRQLERQLNFADHDPHGKPIPTPEQMVSLHGQDKSASTGSLGYAKPS